MISVDSTINICCNKADKPSYGHDSVVRALAAQTRGHGFNSQGLTASHSLAKVSLFPAEARCPKLPYSAKFSRVFNFTNF